MTAITESEKQLSDLKEKWNTADSNIDNILLDADLESIHGVNCEALASSYIDSGTKTTGLDSRAFATSLIDSGTKTTGLDSGDNIPFVNCEDYATYLNDSDDEDTNNISSFRRPTLKNRQRQIHHLCPNLQFLSP